VRIFVSAASSFPHQQFPPFHLNNRDCISSLSPPLTTTIPATMFQNKLSMLVQLSLLSFAMAEETSIISSHGNAWKYGSGGGLIGFIVLILDIIVFSTSRLIRRDDRANTSSAVEVLKSNRPPSHKLLWCVVVFLFPIGGLILYWLFSDRTAHAGSGQYEVIP
jgi:hypothetical protein